ncbi:MAG TPA: type VI secretion system tube protein Hcp [Acetobacteraceae bacterium]|jgi:type VI secretion system secreted protein Hcp|nr:type VI secretion system tube protein Hcp [Acetobacteraceae bacterium]
MAIYAKFDGVNGSVTTTGYQQWIALSDFQWGYQAGSRGVAEHSREVTVSNITLKMRAEQASVDLAQKGLSRAVLSKVQIAFTSTGKDSVKPYLTYDLTNAMVENYSIGAGNEGVPVETFGLSFQKVTFKVTALDSSLTGAPKSVTYDLTQAKTS